MTEHERHESDAVDRAVQAVKAAAGPAGPSEELLASTLEAMRREASAGRRTLRETLTMRITNMKRGYRFAAAAAVLVAAGLGVGWYLYNAMSPSVAFADVVRRVQNARTFQMTIEAQMPNQAPMRMKWMYKEPSGMRMEMESPAQSTTVMDTATGKLVTLMPAQKQAMTMDLGHIPQDQMNLDYLDHLRKAMEGSPRELGERTIDGRSANGYEVRESGSMLEIWVDKRSGDILLARTATPDTGLMPSVTTIMRDFVIDADLDDKLFSLEVPEGYTRKTMPKMNVAGATGEQDLAKALEVMANLNGGIFPDGLAQSMPSRPAPSTGPKQDLPESEEQSLQNAFVVARGLVFAVAEQQAGRISDFHYAGGGIKLGDPRPIAWWLPKDATLYRVLRGDLTFADMPADQLPAAPTTAPATLPPIKERVSVEISDGNQRVGELMVPVLLRLEAAEASAKDQRSWLTITDPRGQRAHLRVQAPATLRVVGPLAEIVGEVELTAAGKTFEVVDSPDRPGQRVLREVKGVPALSTMPTVKDTDAEPVGANIEIHGVDGEQSLCSGTLPARLKFVRDARGPADHLFILVTSAKGTRSQIPFRSPATIRITSPAGEGVGDIQVKEPGQTYEVRESPDQPGRLGLRQVEP